MNLPYDNQTLLQEVQERVTQGTLSRESVLALFAADVPPPARTHLLRFSINKLLYIVGGIVVLLGILFFVAQIWYDIGSFGRIVVTLGTGLLLASSGTFFMNTDPKSLLGDALHAIAGFLIPFGSLVLLDEVMPDIDTLWPLIFIFGVITAMYLSLALLYKRSILIFFLLGAGTIFDWLLIYELFPNFGDMFYLHFAMLTGVVYVYLAYAFRDRWNPYLLGLLNFVGGATFFIAAFINIFEGNLFFNAGKNVLYEMLYPILSIGGMFLATRVQSRGLLLTATGALIAYLVYLTDEYFADSIGWPLALIFVGFAIIGIGYTSIKISQRYLRQ